MVSTVGDGFEFTVPASTVERTLYLYVGGYNCKGNLEASMSDNSYTPYGKTDAIFRDTSLTTKIVTIKFKADTPGQTLNVKYTLTAISKALNPGGVVLQAAALYEPIPIATLMGSVQNNSSSVIDLTAGGATTWGHWGSSTVNNYDSKNGSTYPVNTITTNISGINNFKNNAPSITSATTFNQSRLKDVTWTDGSPTSALDPAKSGLIYTWTDNSNKGNGFEFSVPADTTKRELKIYVGAFRARGKITATLSDNSSAPYTTGGDAQPNAIENKSSSATNKVVSIIYKAASNGQTLNIKFTPDHGFYQTSNPATDKDKTSIIWIQGITVAPADEVPPTVPSSLSVVDKTATSAVLHWEPATDNMGVVAGYYIYESGALIATPTYFVTTDISNYPEGFVPAPTSFYLQNLTPGKTYTFSVAAFDPYANVSGQSNAVPVTLDQDTTPPIPPMGLECTSRSATSVELSWSGAPDNHGTAAYDVYKDGIFVASTTGTQYTIGSLTENGTYTLGVISRDAAGNVSQPAQITVSTDVTAPDAPDGIIDTNKTETSFKLAWNTATDNLGVVSYEVFKDGEKIATVSSAQHSAVGGYAVTGLKPNTAYVFTVKAKDAAGNVSPASTELTVTAVQDSIAPTTPTGLKVTNTASSQLRVTWSPATDNVAVNGYEIYKNGILAATIAGTAYSDSNVLDGVTYLYTVRAVDTSGNLSSAAELQVVADFTRPGSPQNLEVMDIGETTVNLKWNSASDNAGIAAYKVYNGSTEVASVVGAVYSYVVNGLAPFSTYTFKVKAVDVGGNESDFAIREVKTIDTHAPGKPSNLRALGVTTSSVTLAWDAATDNVGVKAYDLYNGDSVLSTVYGTTYDVTGLIRGSIYVFKLVAIDESGNRSDDTVLTVRTGDIPDTTAPVWTNAALTASAVTQTGLTLTWTAASDNTGVTEYKICQDSSPIGTVSGSVYSYEVTGLTASTLYTFKVEARDASGNWTVNGPSKTVRTIAAPVVVTPPSESEESGGDSNPNSGTKLPPVPTPAVSPTPTPMPTPAATPVPAPTPVKPAGPALSAFKDIKGHWAESYAEVLLNEGVINGYPDGTLKPEANITRAEMVKIAIMAVFEGEMATSSSVNFTDTAEIPEWVKGYLKTAVEKGIIEGYGDGSFGANRQLTRVELLAIVMRAFGLGEIKNDTPAFKDHEEIPGWSKGYVAKAVQLGIIEGLPDGTVAPNRNVTRAEVFAVVARCLKVKK